MGFPTEAEGAGLEVRTQVGTGKVTETQSWSRGPARCMQSQEPGRALAKDRNMFRLGSEI